MVEPPSFPVAGRWSSIDRSLPGHVLAQLYRPMAMPINSASLVSIHVLSRLLRAPALARTDRARAAGSTRQVK